MTMSIRRPTEQDHAAWLALWRGYQEFYRADLRANEDRLWGVLLDPPAEGPHALVADDGQGRLLGLAHYLFHLSTWSPAPRCYLNDLFTAGDTRGRGVGRALVEAVEARARERGAGQVWWLTEQDNAVARSLYDRIATLMPFVKYVR